MESARRNSNIAVAIVVAALGLVVLFPFYWMIRSSLMSNIEIYKYPPLLLPRSWRFENYASTLKAFPFLRYILNTLIIAIPALVGTLLTSTLAAYSFARLSFPLKRLWFTLVIGSMLMPAAVTLIPIFVAWSSIGLGNGYTALIVPAFLGGGAFNIFLVRQFFMTIPRDLDEAALLDGAGHLRILFQILVPLVRPVLISVALFAFIAYWNDILGPLIYISRTEQNTISQGLANFKSGFGTDWKAIMAACCVAIVPPVAIYFIGQKYFIEGIVLSGMKA
jgi:multiple sugar transport system permease protein